MKFKFNIEIELQLFDKKKIFTHTSFNRIKNIVKNRNNSTCYYCGKIDDNGHVDHVVPIVLGGDDRLDNLVWACISCNLSKGKKLLDEWKIPNERTPQNELEIIILHNGECDCSEDVLKFLESIISGSSLAFRTWYGSDRPFSRKQYEEIISILYDNCYIKLRTPEFQNNGYVITEYGIKTISTFCKNLLSHRTHANCIQ